MLCSPGVETMPVIVPETPRFEHRFRHPHQFQHRNPPASGPPPLPSSPTPPCFQRPAPTCNLRWPTFKTTFMPFDRQAPPFMFSSPSLVPSDVAVGENGQISHGLLMGADPVKAFDGGRWEPGDPSPPPHRGGERDGGREAPESQSSKDQLKFP